jgi:hypothetical protein
LKCFTMLRTWGEGKGGGDIRVAMYVESDNTLQAE